MENDSASLEQSGLWRRIAGMAVLSLTAAACAPYEVTRHPFQVVDIAAAAEAAADGSDDEDYEPDPVPPDVHASLARDENCLPPKIESPSLWKPPAAISGAYRHGNLQIPLPPGRWRLGGYQTFEVRLSGVTRDAGLAVYGQWEGKTVKSYVILMFNLSISDDGWPHWGLQDCRRTNMHWAYILRNARTDAACMHVNHIAWWNPLEMDAAPHWVRESLAMISAYGVEPPSTVLESAFTFVDQRNFIYLRYRFNPEYAGIQTPPDPNWTSNLWNKRQISGHSLRSAFVSGMIKWTQQAVPVVQDGFRCRLDRNQGVPWPAVIEPAR